MSLPTRTPQERAADLEKAGRVRKERSDAKADLARGRLSLAAVLDRDDPDPRLQGEFVRRVLEALPGVGKVRAKQTMERLGIAESRRIRGLGSSQRAALTAEFEPVFA